MTPRDKYLLMAERWQSRCDDGTEVFYRTVTLGAGGSHPIPARSERVAMIFWGASADFSIALGASGDLGQAFAVSKAGNILPLFITGDWFGAFARLGFTIQDTAGGVTVTYAEVWQGECVPDPIERMILGLSVDPRPIRRR